MLEDVLETRESHHCVISLPTDLLRCLHVQIKNTECALRNRSPRFKAEADEAESVLLASSHQERKLVRSHFSLSRLS